MGLAAHGDRAFRADRAPPGRAGLLGLVMSDPALVLRAARRWLREERAVLLASHCRLDYRLRPKPETIEDVARPRLRRLDRLLRRLDAAIGAAACNNS